MDVSLRRTFLTPEVGASIEQMEKVFGAELSRRAAEHRPFSNVGALHVDLAACHPAFGFPANTRRSFHRAMNTYFVGTSIDYPRWVSPSWADRVDAYADAVRGAVERVAKTRLSTDENAILLDLVERTRAKVRETPPASIEEVGSIYVSYDASGKVISVGQRAAGANVVEVPPQDARTFVGNPAISRSAPPPMFKLYRKDGDTLRYHEAWPVHGKVVEHWGVYGERGDTREHPVADDREAGRVVVRLKKTVRADGFRPIAPGRHATMMIEYPIDGFGDRTDLARRHALEDRYNELTGWLGKGHCDGGSTGSGSMEVVLIVADYERAKNALERETAGTDLAGFNRIYRMK